MFTSKASLFLKLKSDPPWYLTIQTSRFICSLYNLHLSFYRSTNLSYETIFIPSQQVISFHTHTLYPGPSPYKASIQCNFLQKKASEISQADKKLRLDLAKGSQRLNQFCCV